MKEIEVGEFIRTKKGTIRKVETIKSGKRQFTRTTETLINGKFKPDNIVKHSKNIIDLIEVGDYVNGYKVIAKSDDGYIEILTDDIEQGELLQNKDIKSIVTKEQFKSVEYKLEE